MENNFIRNLGLAGLVSGTLDAAAGVVVYDFALGKMSIIQILQWIASGAFGKEAFEMGIIGALYGTIFHYIIAFGASAVYFLSLPYLEVGKKFPIFSGLAFGGWVWIFMNFLVLPNSRTVLGEFSPSISLVGFAWHMALVGVPIAWYGKKYIDNSAH